MHFLTIPAALVLVLASCSPARPPAGVGPLKTAARVDVSRYAGRWFEIARYPQWFQKDCASATAEYSKEPDGSIKVINTCIRADGTQRSVEGSARPVDESNTRLKVTFSKQWYARFIPIPKEGNYWIIDLSKDYRHVIVGTPDRRTLWFLSRSAVIKASEFERMKEAAVQQGFDPARLVLDAHTRIQR